MSVRLIGKGETMFKVTRRWIKDNSTPRGGWNYKQLQAIGVDVPPTKGWIDEVDGKEITEEQADLFVRQKLKSKDISVSERILELEKDSKRLEWLVKNECFPLKTKRGWGLSTDGNTCFGIEHADWRTAIDLVMERE